MRFVFVINPVAGKQNLQTKLKEDIKAYFENQKDEYNIFESEYAGHAREIAKREAEKGDEVVIFGCGGDGTLYDVLNGVYGHSNAAIGVIPLGSGNDFVKTFGGKTNFMSIEYQVKGGIISSDVVKCQDNVSLNVACVGFDAYVAANMTKFKNWPLISGSMSYMLSIFYCLFKFYSTKLKITLDDDETKNGDYMFVVGANACYYGGGFYPAPNAIVNDGFIDVVEIDRVPKLKLISLISKYKKGDIEKEKCCHTHKVKKLAVESESELIANLDGETICAENGKLEFEVLHNAINLWLPSSVLESDDFKKKYEQKVKITEKA